MTTPNLIGIGRPPSMDKPPAAPPSAPSPGPTPPQADVSQAHYLTPEKRCYQCEHFREPSTCSLGVNGGTVDPEGGCEWFAMSDNDGDEGTGTEPGAQGGATSDASPPGSLLVANGGKA